MYAVGWDPSMQITYYYRGINLIGYTSPEETAYYRMNAHGNVVAVVDGFGETLKTYKYDAFGGQEEDGNEWLWRVLGVYEEDTNPFRYCAEYYDEETEFIYLRARYYSPEIQRFISEDPIKDGINWYAYCGNNPVNGADPSGMWEEGDEKLPEWAQSKIKECTDNYYKSETDEDREFHHQEAEKVRAIAAALESSFENSLDRYSLPSPEATETSESNTPETDTSTETSNDLPVLDFHHQTQQGVHEYACVLVCCAMVFAYYGSNVSAMDLFEAYGRYDVNYLNIMDCADMEVKLEFSMTTTSDSELVYAECVNNLRQGIPVIVEIGYTTREGKSGTHSVVVYGMIGDGTKASDFLAMDPWRDEAKNPNTQQLNTLQDSMDMFWYGAPHINNYSTYKPV